MISFSCFIPVALITVAAPAQATQPFPGFSPCNSEVHSTPAYGRFLTMQPLSVPTDQRVLVLFNVFLYKVEWIINERRVLSRASSAEFWVFGIFLEGVRIWGWERAYARSHPQIRGPATAIHKEPEFQMNITL